MITNENKKFGVAFSGGGYRAATYHIGTIQALKDLGVLDKVDVIATNSGGSITGAYYTLHVNSKSTNEIIEGLNKGLKGNIIYRALLHPRCLFGILVVLSMTFGIAYFSFTLQPWLSVGCLTLLLVLILKFQYVIFPISMGIRKAYDDCFFKSKSLTELAEVPKLVMNATNVETGKLWSFSRNKMNDYSYEFEINPPVKFTTKDFAISRAVNASSCVPFAFNPVRIPQKYFVNKEDYKRIHPFLVDGGIYDNQGIHKLIQEGSSFECDIVLVSDAGAASGWQSSHRNVLSLLMRVTNVFMLRTKNMQMISGVFDNTGNIHKQRQIGYFSLSMNPEETVPFFVNMFKQNQLTKEVVTAHQLTGRENDPDLVLIQLVKKTIQWDTLSNFLPTKNELEIARGVSTNLIPLKKEQSEALIKQAYVMTLIFARLYCPILFQ